MFLHGSFNRMKRDIFDKYVICISYYCDLYVLKIVHCNYKGILFLCFSVNPCSPEGFSRTYFPKGGCCNPPWIINTEGHITLNLLPLYRYGHPLSIDTKISTKH